MTEASFKAASKQFDLSLVFKLAMPRLGIRRIENLTLVPSLTELDLSQNRISRLEGLNGLESLKRLVLAKNEIERLEGLEQLNGLETLQMQGNRITNIDDVQSLSSLPCLRHVQFQVRGGEPQERNPMCDYPAYRTAVRRMLLQLQTLDDERTLLSDAALPRDSAEALAALSFAEPEPWLKDFDWGDNDVGGGLPETLGELKSDQVFDHSLTECKRLSAKAQSLIDDAIARTPRNLYYYAANRPYHPWHPGTIRSCADEMVPIFRLARCLRVQLGRCWPRVCREPRWNHVSHKTYFR